MVDVLHATGSRELADERDLRYRPPSIDQTEANRLQLANDPEVQRYCPLSVQLLNGELDPDVEYGALAAEDVAYGCYLLDLGEEQDGIFQLRAKAAANRDRMAWDAVCRAIEHFDLDQFTQGIA